MDSGTDLARIPPEIWTEILMLLDPRDLGRACCTSRFLRDMCYMDIIGLREMACYLPTDSSTNPVACAATMINGVHSVRMLLRSSRTWNHEQLATALDCACETGNIESARLLCAAIREPLSGETAEVIQNSIIRRGHCQMFDEAFTRGGSLSCIIYNRETGELLVDVPSHILTGKPVSDDVSLWVLTRAAMACRYWNIHILQKILDMAPNDDIRLMCELYAIQIAHLAPNNEQMIEFIEMCKFRLFMLGPLAGIYLDDLLDMERSPLVEFILCILLDENNATRRDDAIRRAGLTWDDIIYYSTLISSAIRDAHATRADARTFHYTSVPMITEAISRGGRHGLGAYVLIATREEAGKILPHIGDAELEVLVILSSIPCIIALRTRTFTSIGLISSAPAIIAEHTRRMRARPSQ